MPSAGTWSSLPEGWTALPFSGELPPTLFRYRPLNDDWVDKRMDFEVLDEAVFLAGADTLNDPDEGKIQWLAQGSYEVAVKVVMDVLLAQHSDANPVDLLPKAWEIARAMVNSSSIPKETVDQMHSVLGKLLRIACFTTRPLNGAMWTHYGHYSDSNGRVTPHGGLCIEYYVDESWRQAGLQPVEYVEKRPAINMLARDSLEAQFAYAARVKSPDWAYEDEWRLVAYIEAKPPWPLNLTANSKLKMEGSVRSVILGLNAHDSIAKNVIDAIRQKAPHIALKRVIRDELTAALTIATL